MCQDMILKFSVSTLSGKHNQLLSPNCGTFFSAGGFAEPSPLARDQWWRNSSRRRTGGEWIIFLVPSVQGLSEHLWGVCMWVEGDGISGHWLETKSSQEFCTDLLMTLSWATFTVPLLVSQVCLFLPRSQSLKIIYMRSKKSPKLGKFQLMQIPINANSHHIFLCVLLVRHIRCLYVNWGQTTTASSDL